MRTFLILLIVAACVLLVLPGQAATMVRAFLYDVGLVAIEGSALLWAKTPTSLKPLWGVAILLHFSITVFAILALQAARQVTENCTSSTVTDRFRCTLLPACHAQRQADVLKPSLA